MGCGCLVAGMGLFVPRLAIFAIWLFSDRLSFAFDSFIIGFLGFLLLPYTTFFWAISYAPVAGVTGFGWFLVALGVILDVSTWFGGGDQARRYQYS